MKTLTPGQTIKVPTNFSDERGWDQTPVSFALSRRDLDLQAGAANQGNGQNGPFAVNTNPLLNPTPTPAQGSFVSGNGNVNITGPRTGFQTPTTNGFVTPTLTGGSFYSGSGEVNLTGVSAGAGGGNGGGNGGGYNQYGNLQYTAASRPQVPFEQDPDAWRAYWNYSAQHPETVESVVNQYQPSIRELRLAQGRNSGGQNAYDGHTSDPPVQSFVNRQQNLPIYQYGNNAVSLSWRVG